MIPSVTRVSRPYPTNLGYVDAMTIDLGLGRWGGFKAPSFVQQAVQSVQQVARIADPRAIAARATGKKNFAKGLPQPLARRKDIKRLLPTGAVSTLVAGVTIGKKQPVANADTGADAGFEYFDASGRPITEAEYNRLMSDANTPMTEYQDENGNPISEAEYNQRLAALTTKQTDEQARIAAEQKPWLTQSPTTPGTPIIEQPPQQTGGGWGRRRRHHRGRRQEPQVSEEGPGSAVVAPTPVTPTAPARPAGVPSNADQVGSGWLWIGQNPEMTSVPAVLANNGSATKWFPWGPNAGQQARQWLGVSGLGDISTSAGIGLGTIALIGIGAYLLMRKK